MRQSTLCIGQYIPVYIYIDFSLYSHCLHYIYSKIASHFIDRVVNNNFDTNQPIKKTHTKARLIQS